MMRSILFSGALACGAACAHAAAPDPDGWTVYSDASVWQASDAVPISQIDGTWSTYAPRAGRNTVLMRSRAALGVEKRGWRLGVEARQDAYLTSDRATLDAYRIYQQKRKPTPPAEFALRADYFAWQAQGLRVGYSFAGPRMAGRASTIDVSAAVYGQQRLRERSVRGTLTYPQAEHYGFAATQFEADDRMTYPFMGGAPSARGAGLSLAATLPLLDAWTLRLQADDIASRLRWRDLPVNTESLNSNVSSYDAEGYLNYRPMLSGRHQQLDVSYRIPRYSAAALNYRYGEWEAGLGLVRYAGETIPSVTLARRFGWLTLHGNLETRFDSAGLGLEAGNFRVQLQSDSVRLNQAKARSLQLHYHLVF